jgi:hypothetical protein
MKQEIRKALQAAEQMISKTSSTSVRNFHSSSQGWDITEFAGDIFLTYIRNGLDKTTNLDVAKGLEILLAAKIPASVPLNAITPRIVVEVSK